MWDPALACPPNIMAFMVTDPLYGSGLLADCPSRSRNSSAPGFELAAQVPDVFWAASFGTLQDRHQKFAWVRKSAASGDGDLLFEIRCPIYDFPRSESALCRIDARPRAANVAAVSCFRFQVSDCAQKMQLTRLLTACGHKRKI